MHQNEPKNNERQSGRNPDSMVLSRSPTRYTTWSMRRLSSLANWRAVSTSWGAVSVDAMAISHLHTYTHTYKRCTLSLSTFHCQCHCHCHTHTTHTHIHTSKHRHSLTRHKDLTEEELETQGTASQIGYRLKDKAELNCVLQIEMKLRGIGSAEMKRMWGGMPRELLWKSGEVHGQGGRNWQNL